MSRELKPFKLYGEDIDFIVKKGGDIRTKDDLQEFLNDNHELLTLLYSYEDDLIRVAAGKGTDVSGQDVHHMIKKIYKNIKKDEGCGFDEKKYQSKDFYNMPIIEFKKLFD